MKSLWFSTVSEAMVGIGNRKKGYVIFASPKMIQELAGQVKENVILCAAAGEYTQKGYKQGVISGFEFDLEEAEIIPIQSPPALSMASMKKGYEKVKDNPNAFLMLLCDGLTGMEEKIITTLFFMDEKFKVIGGSAGDELTFTETPIYIGSERVHSVGIFFNSRRRTHIVKENIYIPTGKELLVTDADPMKRVVKSFGSKPASTEYARVLGVREADLPKHFANHPLGVVFGTETYIASPQQVNPDRSITFYCQIMPNTFVKILEPVDAVAKVKETLQELPFKPGFILAVNCILRSLKFQQESLWPKVDSAILGVCSNTTGFVSYGEQYYQRHVNQTMVLLAIE